MWLYRVIRRGRGGRGRERVRNNDGESQGGGQVITSGCHVT